MIALPAGQTPALVGMVAVDTSPQVDPSFVRFYRDDCRELGETSFEGGSWLLTLESSGPRIESWNESNPVPPLLGSSATSCGYFGRRDRWSISTFNTTSRDLIFRLAFPAETRVLEPRTGTTSVLYVAGGPMPGSFQVLDPETCAVLAESPLLDASMEISIQEPFDRQSLILTIGVPVDQTSDAEIADARPSTVCS